METLLRNDSWNPFMGGEPWPCQICVSAFLPFVSSLIPDLMECLCIYYRCKVSNILWTFVFFRSEMRGDVSLVLWFSMVKIKKGHSAIL